MLSEQNIIKFIRQKQADELKPVQKQINDMQNRISECDKIIEVVPDHKESIVDGTVMAYHNAVKDARVASEDRVIYKGIIEDYDGQMAAINQSYNSDVTEFIKNMNYIAMAKQGLLKQRQTGRNIDIHEHQLRAQKAQLDKVLESLSIPDELIKPLIEDILFIPQYEIDLEGEVA